MHENPKYPYVASALPLPPNALSRHTAYLTSCGRGYAQDSFCDTCDASGFNGISRESLGLLKFARDAARDPENGADMDKYGLECYQA